MISNKIAILYAAVFAWSMPASAIAEDFVPPEVYTMTPGGINLSDGSFVYSNVDLSIGPLELKRFYLGGRLPVSGDRMSNNFNIYVAPNWRTDCSSGVCSRYAKPIVHLGLSASGTYYEEYIATSPPYAIVGLLTEDAASGKLTHSAGTNTPYIYTDKDGSIYTFSTSVSAPNSANSQMISNIVFSDGRRQDFVYNGSGRLKEVVDSSGYAIIFDYDGSGQLTSACGFNTSQNYVSSSTNCSGASIVVSYGYTNGLTTSFTDVLGNVTTYGYGSSGGSQLSCVTPPGYSNCKVSNTYQGWQVIQQTMSDGSVWNISYSGDYNGSRTAGLANLTTATLTDPASKSSIHHFVATSPATMTDSNGKTTTYQYRGGWDSLSSPDGNQDHGFSLVEVDLPEGNKYLAEYAGSRRSISKQTLQAKPGSGLSDRTVTFGYSGCDGPGTPQNCAKPIWKKDANGGQIDFTYASWGGMLSEMQPAPTSGAARPLKLYTYVQKYAYVKNSGGTLVSTGVPIWVISTMTQCQTVAGSSTVACDAAAGAPRLQTTYQYGADGTANNLLIKGTEVKDLITGEKRLSCVTYDPIGRKISETSPRGNASITVCP